MKKKVLGMFLVATMAASVLAGCGGKAEDKSEAKKDDTAAAQEEDTYCMVLGSELQRVCNGAGRKNVSERSSGFQIGYPGKSIL